MGRNGSSGALGGAKVIKDSPFRDSRSEPRIVEVARAPQRPVIVRKAPVEPERPVGAEAKPAIPKAQPRPVPTKTTVAEQKEEGQSRRVADNYTERVTLKLSPEMGDPVDALAQELQRARTAKGEQITANTVMRVAISAFLSGVHLSKGESANSEAELPSLAEQKLHRG